MNKQTAVMGAVTTPVAGKPERVEQFFLPSFCDVRLVFAVVVVNFAVDLAYAAVDPRLRQRT